MFELANFCGGKGARNNVCAIRGDHFREVSKRRELHYAHKGLFINIGMVDPTIVDNQLAQFLDRGLCPTVDLTALSTSINSKERIRLRK